MKDEGPAAVGDHGLVAAPVYIVVDLFPTGLSASGKQEQIFELIQGWDFSR